MIDQDISRAASFARPIIDARTKKIRLERGAKEKSISAGNTPLSRSTSFARPIVNARSRKDQNGTRDEEEINARLNQGQAELRLVVLDNSSLDDTH